MLCSDRPKSFIDVLDAQWECEGELIPLDLSVLNPREFLVYQHGLFLMNTLNNLKLVGASFSFVAYSPLIAFLFDLEAYRGLPQSFLLYKDPSISITLLKNKGGFSLGLRALNL